MAAVAAPQRFTRQHPCPVCGGHAATDRGIGQRCWGFLSDDGLWAHCTRPECAGALPLHDGSDTYAHRLDASCRCGREHGVPPAAHAPEPRWKRFRRHPDASPLGTFVRAYVYRDAEGRPLHRTLRYRDPKTFLQQRYDHGSWRFGVSDHVERVLYRLPELLAADPCEWVWWCEGEKDADRLTALGLVATTSASHAWQSSYGVVLAGRSVAILEDNDDDGRRTARRIARGLQGIARAVRVIGFSQMPPGSDVSDWLDAGGTVEELRRVATESVPLEVGA